MLYEEIKIKLKKIQPFSEILKFLRKTQIILTILIILISLNSFAFKYSLKINIIIAIVFFIVSAIIIMIIFFFKYFSLIQKYIPVQKTKKNQLKNLKSKFIIARNTYNYRQKEEFKTKLLEILKEYNVNSKDKLELLIQYYRRYLPTVSLKTIKEIFLSTFSFILMFLIAAGNYDINIVTALILATLLITIIYSLIRKYFRLLKNFINVNGTENDYLEVEEILTLIYLNFELYEKELNSKSKRKTS